MKRQRHKHKESFSLLLISNTGKTSRQFHVSPILFRLFTVLMLLICVSLGWLGYEFSVSQKKEADLQEQIVSQAQLIQQLETEKENLSNEKLVLASENETLLQTVKENTEETAPEEAEAPALPNRYPCTGSGILIASYSQEQPYISIDTQAEGKIIAAGDGTILSVTSDNTYPIIIEIEHENGYRTRYMCKKNAELRAEEGAQVFTGDILVNINTNNTQLDYQIIYENEPIDPLTIIEAEG
ncbi:MAG: M23 family metallopeptidase [Lachnospiraceae bacterium]|nr:M23 family metallopeptidase [Lachnospiraceae bacterium]